MPLDYALLARGAFWFRGSGAHAGIARSLKLGAGLVIPSRRGFHMGLSPVYVIADSPCVPSGGRKALFAPTHTGAMCGTTTHTSWSLVKFFQQAKSM